MASRLYGITNNVSIWKGLPFSTYELSYHITLQKVLQEPHQNTQPILL